MEAVSERNARFVDHCLRTRRDVVEMYLSAEGGHLPAALSLVEPLVALFFFALEKKDHFILSKGHGCLALYAVLVRTGKIPLEWTKKVGHPGSALGWHPTGNKEVFGMDVSSGSLGLGMSVALGKALHARRLNQDASTYCLLGDGECNEGSVWEAAMAAGHKGLSRFHVLIDANGFQACGKTSEVCELEPLGDKWKAFGFEVNDFDLLTQSEKFLESLLEKKNSSRPQVWICRSQKGKGIPFVQDEPSAWHSKNKLGARERSLLEEWLQS